MTADAVGGVWTYATDLATGLAERGVEVVLAVLGPAPSVLGRDRYRGDIRLLQTPLEWTAETPEAVLDAGLALVELAARERVDIVHLNSPALAACDAFRTPVLGVCHSDVATWWAAVKTGPLPPDLAWRAALTGRGYAACDALVAPSRAFAEATAEAFGLQRPPEIVMNGRPLPLEGRGWGGGPASVGFVASAPHPLPPPLKGEGEFVFTCGRLWDEGKGAATLDAAAARLSAPVFAAGPRQGPGTGEIAFKHLIPLGSLPPAEIARWHAEASVFVSPALYEPFGLAVLEAAQAGRPLVLSDIPTFRELWDGAAVFTPPGDAEALATALRHLLGDADERARLGEAARRRAERYTLDCMVDGTLAAYQRLTARRAAA